MKKIIKRVILVILAVLIAAIYSYGEWPRAIYDTDVGANSYENTGKLNENIVLKQTFTGTDQGLCGFSIKLTKLDNQVIGTYTWTVEDLESGEVVGSGVIDESSTENKEFVSSSAQKRGTVKVEFPLQADSKDRVYLLTLEGDNVADENAVAVYMTNKGKNESSLKLNDEELDRACVIKPEYRKFNVETFIVFLAIILYLVVFVKFMYKLFR